MMKKLFGGGSQPAASKAPAKQEVDPREAINKLQAQTDAVNKRITVLESRVTEAKTTALAKRKAKDERGALNALRQMKMYEKELKKLDGQAAVLSQQQMMIESTHFDVGVVNSMQNAGKQIEKMNEQLDVEDVAEIYDQIQEQQDMVNERQDFFIEQADADKDDLLGELDELEADAIAGDFDVEDPGFVTIKTNNDAVGVSAAADAEEQKQEASLANMMAM